ncbi:MAG: hypothetical protein FJ119_05555 [Deltaproteobacteria bacterium]|nr:hypothetical protein [Deltaproteobacteria bacterium]
MERTTFVFLFFIILFLVFSFIKKRVYEDKKNKEAVKLFVPPVDGEKNNQHITVVFAVIAAAMENRPHIIKRVFLKGNVDEKISSWKIAGRSEGMMKKRL